MKPSSRETQERQQAVRTFFRSHPNATIRDCQQALVSGAATGSPGPTMAKGTVCRLRKEALADVPVLGAPAEAASSSTVIEYVFPSGARIRFPTATSPAILAEYVRSLLPPGAAT